MDQHDEPQFDNDQFNTEPYAAAPTPTDAATLAPDRPLRRRRRTIALVSGIAVLCLGFGGGGIALGAISASNALKATTSTNAQGGTGTTNPNSGGTSGGLGNGYGFQGGQGTQGGFEGGSDGSGGSTQSSATAATATQKEGVVTIVSKLNYSDDAEAAGTGIILTSSGEILTNNHVIEGATSIEVTVESTNKTYTATVVGTDSVDDVAVLKLTGAHGLKTAKTDASASVKVGDAETSVGNAEGTGNLVVASGTVAAKNQNITVSDESTGASKQLTGLIELDADVVSGDSGGPLLESDGDVIGMITAASSGSANVTGYAIPIATALKVVKQIESGVSSGNVTVGQTAFLGIELASTQSASGVVIAGVTAGKPAAAAGLVAGDVITAINGKSVTSADGLSTTIKSYKVGDSISVTYTTAAGVAHTVTVTLVAGPAA